jgi:hypothetical protein
MLASRRRSQLTGSLAFVGANNFEQLRKTNTTVTPKCPVGRSNFPTSGHPKLLPQNSCWMGQDTGLSCNRSRVQRSVFSTP